MEPRRLQRIDWSSSEYFACAFVSCENVAEYYCLICESDIFGDESLADHLAGKVHTSALLEFNSCITPYEDDHYHCSTCRHFFSDYRSVYTHLKGTRHAYWRREARPNSTEVDWRSYKRFACSLVLYQGLEGYFCIICGCNIVDKATLTEHLLEKQHMEGLQRNGPYLSLDDEYRLYCSLCRITMSEAEHGTEHIHGETHLANTLEIGYVWNWRDCTNDSYAVDFVFHESGERHYCSICDCKIIGVTTVDEHTRSEAHTNAKKQHCHYISPPKEYSIYCSPCNRYIGKTRNIRSHVLGTEHADSLRARTSSVKFSPDDSTDNFLFRKMAGKYFCCICDRVIGDGEALENHKKDKLHIDDARKHGLRQKPARMNHFFCSICRCSIRDYRTIYRHVTGIKHTRLVNDEASRQSPKPQPCDPNSSEYFVPSFVSNEDFGRSICLRCGCDLDDAQSLNYHRQDARHRDVERHGAHISISKDDSRYCSSCDSFVSSHTKVHNHIDSIKHQEILDSGERAKKEPQSIVSSSSKAAAEDTGRQIDDIESPRHTWNEESPSEGKETPRAEEFSSKETDGVHRADVQDLYGDIYDMGARVEVMKTGMELSHAIEWDKIYCLICRETIEGAMEKYIDHLADSDHCAHLEEMMEDHARFVPNIGGLSEFDLARQYMEDISEIYTRCLVCNEEMNHMETPLEDHVRKDSHRKRCEEMKTRATQNFEAIALRMQCNWYKVQTYKCLVCINEFNSEINFSTHLRSKDHDISLQKLGQAAKELILNFCQRCALLWYGNRSSNVRHKNSLTHLCSIRHEDSVLRELTDVTKTFLAQSENSLEEMTSFLDYVYGTEGAIYKRVMKDLRNTIGPNFPDINFCTFGCRDSNCSSAERYIDVFLGCESVFKMGASLDHEVLLFMKRVNGCLKEDSLMWEFREFITSNRSHAIKIRHRPTGISCEICFEIGLVADITKLIRFFNDLFSECEKLLFFLKRWLTLCDLAGHRHFSIYTLYWSLVFYLQTDLRLPSITSLITDTKGCVLEILARNRSKANCSIKELLMGYFEFYANFEFRYDVACPVIGEAVKKQAFEDLRLLPKGMKSYLVHVADSDNSEPFNIKCAMCIQDPFRLQHNLTAAVSKGDLVRFRSCCSMSLEELRST